MKTSKWMIRSQRQFKSLGRRLQRELRRDSQRHSDVKYNLRCKIVMNLVKGHALSSIQRHLDCSYTTIQRVAERFVHEGIAGLVDRREDNGETKITEAHETFLLRAAAETPEKYGFTRPTWTLELFVEVLHAEFGLRVSTTTISRVLARLDVSLKRPRPIVLCPWKARKRQRKLREIERLLETVPEDEVVLYVDEVDIHLNPKIGSDWMPRGVQKTVQTPGKNEKRYLAGALDPRTGKITYVESDRKNSDLFIDQLWTLAKKDYPHVKKIHLILDNYGIHSSRRTQIATDALSEKIELHFLPPYCPNYNRIERVWKDLHDNVTRNHRCSNMTELMVEVRKYLANRNKNRTQEFRIAA